MKTYKVMDILEKKRVKKIKTFEDKFVDMIDKFISNNINEQESHSITPSSYYKCLRKVWYKLLGFHVSDKKAPRTQRILKVGILLHEWIQKEIFMKMDGYDGFVKLLKAEDLPVYGQEGIEFIKEHDAPDMEIKFKDKRFTKKYQISAMIDGAMEWGGEKFLFEFKTIKDEDFNFLEEPLTDHRLQGAIYSMCLGIPKVMFLYFNKNTQEFKPYMVEYEDKQYDWVKERINLIEEALESENLAPKEEHGCTYCDFKKYCKNDISGKTFYIDEYGYKRVKEIE